MISTLIAIAALLLSAPQDAPQKPATPVPSASSGNSQAAAPAALPNAGEIPASASPRARELWAKLLAAAAPPAGTAGASERAPVTAFDLSFDGRAHPASGQTNDFNSARYRFLAPNFVRTALSSGAERMRGPEGDWLVDTAKKDRIQLVGREYAQDRRELSESLNIAKSFVALTDPARLRIARLEDPSAPPATLPPSLVEIGKRLDWIAIESPDFHLVRASSPHEGQSFRCELGLDRTTHLPELASVWEDENGAMVHETALCVRLTRYRALDQFQVPEQIDVYPADLDTAPFHFANVPSLSLYLRKDSTQTLRARLTPADFGPGK